MPLFFQNDPQLEQVLESRCGLRLYSIGACRGPQEHSDCTLSYLPEKDQLLLERWSDDKTIEPVSPKEAVRLLAPQSYGTATGWQIDSLRKLQLICRRDFADELHDNAVRWGIRENTLFDESHGLHRTRLGRRWLYYLADGSGFCIGDESPGELRGAEEIFFEIGREPDQYPAMRLGLLLFTAHLGRLNLERLLPEYAREKREREAVELCMQSKKRSHTWGMPRRAVKVTAGLNPDGSFAGYEVRLELRETFRFTFDPAKEEKLRRMMNRPIAETRLLPDVLAEWMKDNYINEAKLEQILSGI